MIRHHDDAPRVLATWELTALSLSLSLSLPWLLSSWPFYFSSYTRLSIACKHAANKAVLHIYIDIFQSTVLHPHISPLFSSINQSINQPINKSSSIEREREERNPLVFEISLVFLAYATTRKKTYVCVNGARYHELFVSSGGKFCSLCLLSVGWVMGFPIGRFLSGGSEGGGVMWREDRVWGCVRRALSKFEAFCLGSKGVLGYILLLALLLA
ncbi:hypothetical protein K432DRAFT_157071 [Lepidopterella palustris CBS 459.81]|uniref:Uncharacterized protein n=1 Tax=Lepidopterella palustris CBS 459.81 TaxID=1314670 RepID=A0A8E2JIN0_9PEZI|nr:hypothetical protein K432DRAFT_157071 [Lepidopterella palustris CBS 459.81]